MTDFDTSPDDQFDPSEHTVQDVLDYIEGHPADADRVIAAEAAGQDRSTIAKAFAPAADEPEQGQAPREARSGGYVLEKGDNPSVVARKLYGRGSRGREIVAMNPGVKWGEGAEIQVPSE